MGSLEQSTSYGADGLAASHAARQAFGSVVRHAREREGHNQTILASLLKYDRSYISKIESGDTPPTPMFADRVDQVLHAGGTIRRAFQAYLHTLDALRPLVPDLAESNAAETRRQTGELVVLDDHAALRYDIGVYVLRQRRRIQNVGHRPVNGYPVRVHVDKFPDDELRSARYYRANPLVWQEIGFRAWHGGGRRIALKAVIQTRTDSLIEAWVHFEDDYGAPHTLYPGEETSIEYEYAVTEDKWGPWFQRAVRYETRHLSVQLDFPVAVGPHVWGKEKSLAHPNEYRPFPTKVRTRVDGTRKIYSWSTDDPPMHARFRMEWRFDAPPEADEVSELSAAEVTVRPSEHMARLGIAQRGDEVLHAMDVAPFDLPTESEEAAQTITRLEEAANQVQRLHYFRTGMGIAAPQIGIRRAVALYRSSDGRQIVLLNPRIVFQSKAHTEETEGCLSFFDWRGSVSRPAIIAVAYEQLDGTEVCQVFHDREARDVHHEIDHLAGLLYVDRMTFEAQLTPSLHLRPPPR